MAKKTRVYELARELGKTSRDILELLADSGVRDKNHMSALDDNVVRFIKNKFAEIEGKKPEAPVGKGVSEEVEEPPVREVEVLKPKKPDRKAKTPGALGALRGAGHLTSSADFKKIRSQMSGAKAGAPTADRKRSSPTPDRARRPRTGDRRSQGRSGTATGEARRRQKPMQWPTQIAPAIPPRKSADKAKPQADALARSRAARARQAEMAAGEAKKLEVQEDVAA
ncbi:MAG: translation initiation factor IF-2 N-terminal domain-containing protein, partial [Bacillota bacterium]